LRRAADLRGNRSHRRPPRGMILLMLENQPNGARAHLRRKPVRCLACHRSTFSRFGASGKAGAVYASSREQVAGVVGAARDSLSQPAAVAQDKFAAAEGDVE